MKIYAFSFFILFGLIISMPQSALAKRFGLGVVIGTPTGFTGKYYYKKRKAYDGAIGWTSGRIHLHVNHLWHKNKLFALDGENVGLFYGVGGRLKNLKNDSKNQDELNIGIRGPFGLRYFLKSASVEFYGELALVMDFVPDTGFGVDLGIGARYYF